MKIAIFHNFMDNIGGAEIVSLILARELGADIYTTNINEKMIEKMGFSTDKIKSIGKVPINAPLRQEMTYWKFRKLNLGRKYDYYIIAGDWAMGAALNHSPHLWYVFSPTREIWDLHDYTRKNSVPFYSRVIFDLWVKVRRMINKRDSREVERIVAISKNVQKRVKKYLGRDSKIVYPPTETEKYKNSKSEGYWLSVNRLTPHKRVDLQLKAFKELPEEKLIIIGSYEKSKNFKESVKKIKRKKPGNVNIVSWADQEEVIKLYSKCKGLIATSKNEDYGMSPVEAMASGKPVIAANEGGYKETVIDKKTGILIDNISAEKLSKAIKSLKGPESYKKACLNQAKKFSTKRFIKEIKEEIENSFPNYPLVIASFPRVGSSSFYGSLQGNFRKGGFLPDLNKKLKKGYAYKTHDFPKNLRKDVKAIFIFGNPMDSAISIHKHKNMEKIYRNLHANYKEKSKFKEKDTLRLEELFDSWINYKGNNVLKLHYEELFESKDKIERFLGIKMKNFPGRRDRKTAWKKDKEKEKLWKTYGRLANKITKTKREKAR